MDKLLSKILKSDEVRNIISRVSSKSYKNLSFKEKVGLYKEFNDIIAMLLETDLNLYINREINKDLYKNITLYDDNKSIVINGINGNPYLYLKDIIIHHLVYIYNDGLPLAQVGDVKYNDNYIESQCNIVLYNKENIEIVKKVANLMDKLLIGINNEYTEDFKMDFDLNITKEGKNDLLLANEIFDEEMKFGFYDKLKEVEEKILATFNIKENKVNREDLALLSLDEVVVDLLFNFNNNLKVFDKYLNGFVLEFFPEFKDKILIKGSRNGIYINGHLLANNQMFIDGLFKEMALIDKKESVLKRLDTSIVSNYSKLDSYFFTKLKELDSYLENKGLEAINYVKWSSVYKSSNEENVFEDVNDIFSSLVDDKTFLSLIEKYLNGKKNNIDNITQVFDYLNKVYYNAPFKLILDRKYGEESFGSSGNNKILISLGNNKDKIFLLTTLFHEYRHLIQEREIKNNHNIFSEKIYDLIKYNHKLSDFEVAYSYFSADNYGYSNQFYYAMQPVEYDAEYFSYRLSKAILSKLGIHPDYDNYFTEIYINNRYISPQKVSVNSYANYLKIDGVKDSYSKDKLDKKELNMLIKSIKTPEDAINVIKHNRFIYLSAKDKERVFKSVAGNKIKVKYIQDSNVMQINDKKLSLYISSDYQILEVILKTKGIELINEGRLKADDLSNYIFREASKYKPDNYEFFNVLTAYYYHSCFDKYSSEHREKRNSNKRKK